ncbi:hypothetical protein K2Z83_19855 [Oscillochloris sp. ZM17-4]|uniref:hypothetical protein n=1 Tax=Oscillochloris sp. ZM17-4 TaxID=2866714 RepID=UPI001C73353C|nr:hypothetical protein [Oscillochloris sp. ZM17-4]MBX0329924.1 hypothetical protein [Oscillochloris sp. ZM17-4]
MPTDTIRPTLTTLQAALHRLAQTMPPTDWTDTEAGMTARAEAAALARLRAAEAAIQFAAALLRNDDPPIRGELQHIVGKLGDQIRAWRKTGRGWFEERTIARQPRQLPRTEASQADDAEITPKTYGPYYYFRWRDPDRRIQTQYLGKSRPAEMDTALAFPSIIINDAPEL